MAEPGAQSMNGIPDGLFVSIGGARGSEVVVALYGERDIASAPVLSSVLPGVIASGTGPLVLELGPLSFIDCAGMWELMAPAPLASRPSAGSAAPDGLHIQGVRARRPDRARRAGSGAHKSNGERQDLAGSPLGAMEMTIASRRCLALASGKCRGLWRSSSQEVAGTGPGSAGRP